MRNIKSFTATLIALVFTIAGFAQTVVPSGSPGQVTDFKGGIKATKTLTLPVTDADPFPAMDKFGQLRMSPTDSIVRYFDGIQWVALGGDSLQSILDRGSVANNSIVLSDGSLSLEYKKYGQKYTKGGNITSVEYLDPIANVKYSWPAKIANDTVAMLSDIAHTNKSNIPKDFFISCTYNVMAGNANEMTYKTDIYRKIDISVFTGDTVFSTNWVEIEGNDIFIHGQKDNSVGNLFVLSLRECKIVNNILSVSYFQYQELPEVTRNITTNRPYSLHSSLISGGMWYLATRTSDNNGLTQVIKINPYSLSDYRIVSFPNNPSFTGTGGHMEMHKNSLYFLVGTQSSSSPKNVIRINENLDKFEVLATLGTTTDKRLGINPPFIIYNEEIYIMHRNNIAPQGYNEIGVSVYNINTMAQTRSISNVVISTGSTTIPGSHWMSVFKDKLIISTASSLGANKRLVRFAIDNSVPEGLIFEESYDLNYGDGGTITNDNSITSEGDVLLNSELTSTGVLRRLKYDNFDDNEVLINPYYSLGTPNPKVNTEVHLYSTKQIKNDGSDGSSPYATIAEVSHTWQQTLANDPVTTTTPIVKGVPLFFRNASETTFGSIYADDNYLNIGVSGKPLRLLPTGLNPAIDIYENGGLAIPFTHGSYSNTLPNASGTLPLTVSVNGGTPQTANSAGNVNITVPAAGPTNLTNTPNPTSIAINSSTGTGTTIPAATGTNAGVLLPGDFTKLANLADNANATYFPYSGGTFTGVVTSQNIIPDVLGRSNGNLTNYWGNIVTHRLYASSLAIRSGGLGLQFQSSGLTALAWISNGGNFMLRGTDVTTNTGEKLQVDGQALVTTAPTSDNHVVRLLDTQFYRPSYTAVTSTYTTGTAKNITASGTFTITLATTGIPDGMEYYIENTGTGTITIDVQGGGTIEGAATKTNNVQWSGTAFIKTGSNYIIKN
jgi:hypothetical protein